jgi:alpha-D-ribose 1-methylphosphonate 5-triphosphate diphosphatase
LAPVTIEVGRPLTASLRRVRQFAPGSAEQIAHVGTALWRDGQLVFTRESVNNTVSVP